MVADLLDVILGHYDGWRIVVCKTDGKVQLLSRNGRDHSRRFGELARAIGALPETTLILDGEIAIFDEHLISRFECSGM